MTRATHDAWPAHVRAYGPRAPMVRDPEPYWTPARFVHEPQTCSFCGYMIPRASPGSTTGTRGTKAYFNSLTKVWECIGCRQEALRAQGALLNSLPAASRALSMLNEIGGEDGRSTPGHRDSREAHDGREHSALIDLLRPMDGDQCRPSGVQREHEAEQSDKAIHDVLQIQA